MGTIPLGDGVVGIKAIVDELLKIGFDGPTTLEVAGTNNVIESIKRLRSWTGSQG
jgi:inosose dehydratase